MAEQGEKYRLKKIKHTWYSVHRVNTNSVVLMDSRGHQFVVSLDTLNKEYTKEK